MTPSSSMAAIFVAVLGAAVPASARGFSAPRMGATSVHAMARAPQSPSIGQRPPRLNAVSPARDGHGDRGRRFGSRRVAFLGGSLVYPDSVPGEATDAPAFGADTPFPPGYFNEPVAAPRRVSCIGPRVYEIAPPRHKVNLPKVIYGSRPACAGSD